MPPLNCFVLDLDDTLYPERDYVRSGFHAVGAHVFERLGVRGFGDVCWQAFLRGERGRIFDSALMLTCGAVDASLVAELVHAYRSHTPQIELYPDARRFLDQARRLHLPLALITDGPRESQWAKIDALALRDAFSPIVVTDDLGPGKFKPHPESFGLVERVVGYGLRHVYVADNPHKDFLTPNQMGWTSIRIQRLGGLYSQAAAPTPPHEPQITINSLDHVWDAYKQGGPAMRQGLESV